MHRLPHWLSFFLCMWFFNMTNNVLLHMTATNWQKRSTNVLILQNHAGTSSYDLSSYFLSITSLHIQFKSNYFFGQRQNYTPIMNMFTFTFSHISLCRTWLFSCTPSLFLQQGWKLPFKKQKMFWAYNQIRHIILFTNVGNVIVR